MPWYKLEVSHGPGHQSRGLPDDIYSEGPEYYSYFYYDYEISSPTALREEFKYLTRELDSPIGEMEWVDRLPDDVIEYKLEEYRGRLERAKEMIAILEDMKEK